MDRSWPDRRPMAEVPRGEDSEDGPEVLVEFSWGGHAVMRCVAWGYGPYGCMWDGGGPSLPIEAPDEPEPTMLGWRPLPPPTPPSRPDAPEGHPAG